MEHQRQTPPAKAHESGAITSLKCSAYTIGLINALFFEFTATLAILDERHNQPEDYEQKPRDANRYTWGRIGKHNVVVALLPASKMGKVSAATTVMPLISAFPWIRVGLLVGIGGGVPNYELGHDIRLGDVVISVPGGRSPGVVEHDFGRETVSGFENRGVLSAPPEILLSAIEAMKGEHEFQGETGILTILDEMRNRSRGMSKSKSVWIYQGTENDRLFRAAYHHRGGKDCSTCEQNAAKADGEINRDERDSDEPVIHYGLIASGDTVMKDAEMRDNIAADIERRMGAVCFCFEMEAAGLMNSFPSVVVRGISDYSDSHKNDRWQKYAAMTAAACAKELLSYAAPENVEVTKTVKEALEDINCNLTEMKTDVRYLTETVEAVSVSKIWDWLKPPNASTNFNDAKGRRHQRTASWFVDHSDEFANWVSGSLPSLWLHGMSGCGKTVLSSAIIEHLHGQCLYFFFDFQDEQKQSLDNTLRWFIRQLYYMAGIKYNNLIKLFSSHGDGTEQPSLKDLATTFDEMVQQLDGIPIILDAIDECDKKNRPELLRWLKERMQPRTSQEAKARILVTSRSGQPDIESTLTTAITRIISVDEFSIRQDIRAFVHHEIHYSRVSEWNCPGDKALRERVEKALINKAGVMFRWADLQLKSLKECHTVRAIESALADLPKDLNVIYTRSLRQVPERHKRDVVQLLQLLMVSGDAVTREMALDVMAVNLDAVQPQRPFQPENRMQDLKALSTIMSNLISVSQHHNGVYFRLAHSSVKDYLLLSSLEHPFNGCFLGATTHASLVRVCLAYIISVDPKCRRDKIKQEYPLAEYSAQRWPEHARHAETDPASQESILRFFLKEREAYTLWGAIHQPDVYKFISGLLEIKNMGPPLYYASFCELACTVEKLLKQDANPNEQGGRCGNALQAASNRGHEKIVQMLLDKGADVNAQGGEYGNALYAALVRGYEKIVQILVDNGADVNAQGGEYGNALYAALATGHEKIVQILVDNGANVNAQGGHFGTILQAASYRGHEKIVQMLLDKGADVNAQGGEYGNALYAALARGHEKIVQILVDNSADVNAQGGEYGNALYAALVRGHEKIVQILVDNGADVNAQGGEYGNALYAALARGYKKIVQILVDNGANVNAQGGHFGTILQAASYRGYEEIVQMLLDKGADVNAQGGHFGTILQAASYRGHEKIIQILLNKGADANAQGGRYGNALQAASLEGHEKIVQILVDNGADVNAQGGEYSNALYAALARGHKKIVQILVDNSANVNAQGGHFGTILQAASYRGYEEIVQMLLDKSANVNAQGGYFGTILQAASYRGHEKIIQILLNKGADVNAQGGRYGNALQAASLEGHEKIVQILVDNGADINAQGGRYSNALQATSYRGHEKIVRMLLDKGADANAQGGHFGTVLQAASYRGHEKIVQMLLDKGADVNTQGGRYGNALQAASLERHEKIVQILVDNGADINAQGGEYSNALQAASYRGHEKIVQILVDNSADVNAQGGEYSNALQAASYRGHEKIVQILVDNGADVNAQGGEYGNALYAALARGHKKIVQILVDNGADVDAQGSAHELGCASLKANTAAMDLFMKSTETIREIAKFIKGIEKIKEHNHFYSRLMVHCVVVRDHVGGIKTSTDPSNSIILQILDQFESIITSNVQSNISGLLLSATHPRLRALNDHWERIRDRSERAKFEFIKETLDFRLNSNQHIKFLNNLKNCEDMLMTQIPDDRSEWQTDDFVLRRKGAREPSFAVWNAAQSLFKALVAANNCTCHTTHDYHAILCLGTYRTPDLEEDFDFDMFLALENHRQETRIHTFKRSVVRPVVRFAVNSETEPPQGIMISVPELCRSINALAMTSICLKFQVGGGQLWKLEPEISHFRIDGTRDPITLQELITQRPESLTEKTKCILAVLLSFTVLHFYGTPWLQRTWGSSSILFFHTTSSAIPLKPYMDTRLVQNLACSGPLDEFQSLVTLAVMLMELFCATSFTTLAKRYGFDIPDSGDNQVPWIDAKSVFEEWKFDINSQCRYAVEKCLDPQMWEDDEGCELDIQTLRIKMYEEIVSPLEDELQQSFGYISIEDLDNYAQTLDLRSWSPQPNHPPFQQ
ncbi:ankyrin repeat-containing domain protein [Phaeosphaeriaceae sp. PMI808]|nr:ankyrin repeat-containing domain protein [Phaeosphaeriaceae sp. PMI808]